MPVWTNFWHLQLGGPYSPKQRPLTYTRDLLIIYLFRWIVTPLWCILQLFDEFLGLNHSCCFWLSVCLFSPMLGSPPSLVLLFINEFVKHVVLFETGVNWYLVIFIIRSRRLVVNYKLSVLRNRWIVSHKWIGQNSWNSYEHMMSIGISEAIWIS